MRLDVLKKNTPAANDDLNVIGNSRSTPKEKAAGVKKEDTFGLSPRDRARKPNQETDRHSIQERNHTIVKFATKGFYKLAT